MKKILVTGANGFVGNHLVQELAENGYSVTGIGGAQGSEKPPYIDDYLVVDLMDAAAVAAIDFNGIDGIIHLAGLAAVGPSFDDPNLYVRGNIGMEINLCEAALKQGVKPKIIIISSGTLYDPAAALPLNEKSPVLPNSPYAVSKIGQEQMGLYYQIRGIEAVIARPFNHIGPGQNLGFLLPDLTKQVIDVERNLTRQVLVGNLEAKRDYTDVRDIVRAYRLLLETGVAGQTYNICSGTSVSGNDILAAVIAASGISPTIEQDPARMRPSDTLDIYGSHDKLTTDTRWQPQIDLRQTIQDVIDDWRSR